jgi:hypothetical protein
MLVDASLAEACIFVTVTWGVRVGDCLGATFRFFLSGKITIARAASLLLALYCQLVLADDLDQPGDFRVRSMEAPSGACR